MNKWTEKVARPRRKGGKDIKKKQREENDEID